MASLASNQLCSCGFWTLYYPVLFLHLFFGLSYFYIIVSYIGFGDSGIECREMVANATTGGTDWVLANVSSIDFDHNSWGFKVYYSYGVVGIMQMLVSFNMICTLRKGTEGTYEGNGRTWFGCTVFTFSFHMIALTVVCSCVATFMFWGLMVNCAVLFYTLSYSAGFIVTFKRIKIVPDNYSYVAPPKQAIKRRQLALKV